jgi:hypothetical protein
LWPVIAIIISLQAKPLKRKLWLMRGKDYPPMPQQIKYSVIRKRGEEGRLKCGMLTCPGTNTNTFPNIVV